MNFQLFSGDRVVSEGNISMVSNSNTGISAGHNINSESMPERTYYYIKKKKEINIIKSKDSSDCIVCLLECGKNNSYRLNCACRYSCHKKCLEKWLDISKTCPFCKI